MDYKEFEYIREQKKAYKIFTEDALIDIIVRKNKQIKELETKLFALPAVIHSGNWKCLLCGRDKFTHKTPHKCVGGYRKRNIIWQKLS